MTVTPVAVPVPGRPLLVVVIVKTAFSPALIGLFAAVFVVVTAGGRQTIDAFAFGIAAGVGAGRRWRCC